ncbi:MAG: glycosyltransferase family 4 protein [Xanthomonadales bacterium]|nr:glycosyltransferase family 4 protein [Xanthomonadales bacterium]
MLDLPGQRRSHQWPTPRGGGIGIVLVVLACLSILSAMGESGSSSAASMALVASITLVALVGWIDDHRGLSAGIRIVAHGFAVTLLAWPVLGLLPDLVGTSAWPWVVAGLLVAAGAVIWSINLHNFMDGIDGLLASQAVFVFAALALLCLVAGRIVEAQAIGLFAAATLGFLPFNFPQARVFMGDVGSGVLGLLVAIATGWLIGALPAGLEYGLIVSSAFVVDSTATLVSRMFSGRRWYSAHREHLYQWLVRSGFSHVRVTLLYSGWNLLVLTPVLLWLNASPDQRVANARLALIAVYASAVVIWVVGKRYCLNKNRKLLRPEKT